MQHAEEVQQDDDADRHVKQPQEKIPTQFELRYVFGWGQITWKMFIRMMTPMGTPRSHRKTLFMS